MTYELTDAVLEYVNARTLRLFRNYRNTLGAKDESTIISKTKLLFDELNSLNKSAFLLIGRYTYNGRRGFPLDSDEFITEQWLQDFLFLYNPVTKYVYENEVERKRGRMAEAVIASPSPQKDIDTALRYWVLMTTQYAIDVTDQAYREALLAEGVSRVRWVAEMDDRTCPVCRARDDRVYAISAIPPKPHINCRCWLEVVV